MILSKDIVLEIASPRNAKSIYQDVSNEQNFVYLESAPVSFDQHVVRHEAAQFHKSPDNPDMIWLYWIANYKDCYVGTVEIGVFPLENQAEIGFTTFQRFRGQGFATAYCNLAIAEFQDRFPSTILQASVNEFNVACISVLKKLGFRWVRSNVKKEFILGGFADELIFEWKRE